MGNYSQVISPSVSVMLGSRCNVCYCMVQDTDKWLHDSWHSTTNPPPGTTTTESNEEMLRRLLREVMELSQRMDET